MDEAAGVPQDNFWSELEDGISHEAAVLDAALEILNGKAVAYSVSLIGDDQVMTILVEDTLDKLMLEVENADECWEVPTDDGVYAAEIFMDTAQGPWYLIGDGLTDGNGELAAINEARFASFVADFALLME